MALVKEECVIDALLCFISNNLDSYDKDLIINSCESFYSQDAVTKSLKIICDVVKEPYKWKKSDSKKKLEMSMIFDKVKAARENNILPKFVADSFKSFPIFNGFEYVIKEMTEMRVAFEKMREDFSLLKKENKKQNIDEITQDISTISKELIDIKLVLKSEPKIIKTNATKFIPGTSHHNTRADKKKNQYETPLNTSKPTAPTLSPDIVGNIFPNMNSRSSATPSAPPIEIEAPSTKIGEIINVQKEKNSESSSNEMKNEKLGQRVGKYWVYPDGFMEHIKTNKKLKGVIGSNMPQTQEIYIGRINFEERVDFNILGHFIERKCNIKVLNCYELNCRDPRFKSFKVIVNTRDSNKLFNAKLWAFGTEVREFVSKKPIRDNNIYNHA
jgi:hypothetical protein